MLNSYIVLDFTDDRGEIGPMLLGDLGADVIRVELPTGLIRSHHNSRLSFRQFCMGCCFRGQRVV